MLEQLIKQCNELLFEYAYPDGELQEGSDQHRDLIRTFFAGAVALTIASDDLRAFDALSSEVERMMSKDWRPDSRFNKANLPERRE